MAYKRQRKNGTWEFEFQRKGVLPSPVYFTFDTEEEGDRYVERVEPMLAKGIVPIEMTGTGAANFESLIEQYRASNAYSRSDVEMFDLVSKTVGRTKIIEFSYNWVEIWVNEMVGEGKAPSTIKKRVEFLSRTVDWAMRRNLINLANNPIKLLPRGYATRDVAREKIWAGERDRRLEGTEEGAIRRLLKNEDALLFDMALETAMRMREMYTLTVDQINLGQRTIFLDKTKNGSKRQVPISSTLLKLLSAATPKETGGILFPYWNGSVDRAELKRTTERLSERFGRLFDKAGCPDLRFHDLRHEATSRLFEKTSMTDTEIASITGHKDPRMLKRYANLRASTLATKMW